MELFEVKGLDVKIDDSIQQICAASDVSACNAKGILYALLLVSILFIIAAASTCFSNWPTGNCKKLRQ